MVFLDHVQNLHIHAEKTHKDSGAHCMNMLILYMVQKTHTGPYYRVLALFMCGVMHEMQMQDLRRLCLRALGHPSMIVPVTCPPPMLFQRIPTQVLR